MDKKYFLGIDCGTTAVKVTCFDLKGELVFLESSPNILIRVGRKVELDMEVLWNNVLNLIKFSLFKYKVNAFNIKAIGVTGQGEGCWLLDENKNPLGNAILWNDNRASNFVKALNSDEKLSLEIKKITGSNLFSGATSVLLSYIKENEPERYSNIKHVLFCKDFIRFKLTGELYTDYTDTSTSVLNLKTGRLSKKIFQILNIEEAVDFFPEIKSPFDSGGFVNKEISKITGLSESTEVAIGMLDIISALLGVGAENEGDISVTLGTTCSCGLVVPRKTKLTSDAGFEIHYNSNMLLEVMATMSGAGNLDWILKLLFKDYSAGLEKPEDFYLTLEERINEVPAGSYGVVFMPYISQSGERMPFNNPNARAQFYGLSTVANKYILVKSVLEGVGMSIFDCIKNLSAYDEIKTSSKIYLTGGGAKSNIWPQIIADICGLEVIVLNAQAFSARGAAISSMIMFDKKNSVDAMKNIYTDNKKYKPNYSNHELYQKIYKLYYEIRISQNSVWDSIKEIRDASKLKAIK